MPNNVTTKWAKKSNRHFSKEHSKMANRNMKRCSASQVIKETQVKSTVRHHLMPVGMAIIKIQEARRVVKDVEK